MQLPAECPNPDAVSMQGLAQEWIQGLPKHFISNILLPEASFLHLRPTAGFLILGRQRTLSISAGLIGKTSPLRSPWLSFTHKRRCKLKGEQTHILCLVFIFRKSLAACCVGHLCSVNICELSLISHICIYVWNSFLAFPAWLVK